MDNAKDNDSSINNELDNNDSMSPDNNNGNGKIMAGIADFEEFEE